MSENQDTLLTNLTNTDWRAILFHLRKSETILVLGPGAITNQDGKVLHDKLCGLLKNEIGQPDEQCNNKLFALSEQLKSQRAGNAILIENAEKVYKSGNTNEFLKKVSLIPFHLILTTSPDTMLRNAFVQNSISHTYDFYNFRSSPSVIDKPTKQNPLIYSLFGSVDVDDSLILSYGDLYEFLFAILGTKQLPIAIRDEIRLAQNFVFLGFDFENWYLQIILRLFEIHNDKTSYAYVWENIKHETAAFYINQFRVDFVQGDIKSFIEALYEKCSEENILREKQQTPPITEQIRNLIKENRIDEVIDMLENELSGKDEDLLDQVYILSGRYNRIMSKIRKKTVAEDYADRELNQINAALHEIVDKIEEL